MALICYFLAGIVTGLLSTLFGFGGGFVVVPLLYHLLPLEGVAPSLAMHIAIGTSLMFVLFNMTYAALLHYQRGNILSGILYKMLPYVIVGAILGSFLSTNVPGLLLRYIFILFLLYVLAQSIKNEYLISPSSPKQPGLFIFAVVSTLTGLIAALLGIGGSVITIPFLRHYKIPMINAAALGTVLAIPSSLIGSLTLMIMGMHAAGLPRFSTGFIHWPAFLCIFIGSFFSAHLGIRLASNIPDKVYGKIYVLLLAIVILAMVI